MSVEAITLALSANVERSSTKFVLVAMANCANSDMTCWPSIPYLCDATSQDRKTVIENMKRLKEAGFIEDTGKRTGATGQVIIYRLLFSGHEQAQKRNSTKSGTVPKTDRNSTVFPVKESRFSVETGPKTVPGTVKEPSKEPSRNKTKADKPPVFDALGFLIANGVEPQVAADWLAVRKLKRAATSETAINGIAREAAKAGMSLHDALDVACQRGWAGFKADWVANSIATNARASPPRMSHSDQSKLAAARAIFGTDIEANHGQSTRIIDVTPSSRPALGIQDFSGDAG